MSNQYNVDDILNEIKAKKHGRTKPLHVLLTDRNLVRHADRLLKHRGSFVRAFPCKTGRICKAKGRKCPFLPF